LLSSLKQQSQKGRITLAQALLLLLLLRRRRTYLPERK
jgi:hypothetical protein